MRRPHTECFKHLAFSTTILAVLVLMAAGPAGAEITAHTDSLSFGVIGQTAGWIPSPDATPRGLAYDGEALWVCGDSTDQLYRIDGGGNVLMVVDTPTVWSDGLTYDGEFLWHGSSYLDRIYKLDPADGGMETYFNSPGGRPDGLAFDGTALWHADYDLDRIYRIHINGSVLGAFDAPGPNPNGLTFDGTHLWNADSESRTLYRLTTAGTLVGAYPAPGDHPTGMTWDGAFLWVADNATDRLYRMAVTDPIAVGESQTLYLTLANDGEADRQITDVLISGENAGELQADGAACTCCPLPPGIACTLSVTFSPKTAGEKLATLLITADGQKTVSVDLDASVAEPPATGGSGDGGGGGCFIDTSRPRTIR